MLSVFFSETGNFLINILPEGMKMDMDYFADNITDEMERLCSHREGDSVSEGSCFISTARRDTVRVRSGIEWRPQN
jgi:flavin reductase (DIM6/NTAB) family NADH-FMN oxidoreductase RutF